MEYYHQPVMLGEVLKGLKIKPGGTYVDCTLGGGGHSEAILKALGQAGNAGRLVGLDLDPAALAAARERLSGYGSQTDLIQANFVELGSVLDSLGILRADGVLFDLGVSSPQLDNPGRGFSYNHDAPLDMRMNPAQQSTAKELVNELPAEQLFKIIKDYGEERWASRIARFIVSQRSRRSIETTGQLVDVIKKAIPAAARRNGPHPARRTFQALRIAVNKELEVLEQAVKSAVDRLRPGGRICVITFHSLEDRVVKNSLREMAVSCTCPKHLPVCTCSKIKRINIISARPLVPSVKELADNPRARSAKLRIAEKI